MFILKCHLPSDDISGLEPMQTAQKLQEAVSQPPEHCIITAQAHNPSTDVPVCSRASHAHK